MSALRVYFDDIDDAPPTSATDGEQPTAAAGAGAPPDWLPLFRKLLQQGDVEAKDLWASKHGEIVSYLPTHVVQRISHALENFEFGAALLLLPESMPSQPRTVPERPA
jgi:hypothetical protein